MLELTGHWRTRRTLLSNVRLACASFALLTAALAGAGPVSAPKNDWHSSATPASASTFPALSTQARQVHAWVVNSGNQQGMPFALIDKTAAQLHLFDAKGALHASSPVLLGLAQGDYSVPGIGERKMSEILAHERTTPAGRFVSEPGRNLQGHDIVWIEYDTAVSLHRVRSSNAAERRLQRLASSTAADNRISYGCVNVPVAFYDRYIVPYWGQQSGVIYVLPDSEDAASFFGFDPAAYPVTATGQ